MFRNREEAGELLAQKLVSVIKNEDVIVLGIPRGGVVVAKEIAKRFDLPLDIVVVKKIGAPTNPELAIGAVGPKATVFWDEILCRHLTISVETKKTLQIEKDKERKAREKLLRGTKPMLQLKGKTVIVVDDGVATGATVMTAQRYLKKEKAKEIILAIPVVSSDTFIILKEYFDNIVVLRVEDYFSAVGQFYQEFPQVEDDEVIKILKSKD